ncbi:MAG: Rrf2 family transcriptional regulator [Eudoraea sp.]|nr:Rrf2 family transcriptional regulator [Eudoraea sp.]
MLSNSGKYALKAVLYLADKTDSSNKLMVKDLYQPTQVPKAYLAKLLQNLSKHNIISSTKGPKGGYYLTKENKENSVYRVIEVIDGNQRMEACVLGIEECNAQHPCPLHEYVGPSRAVLLGTLKKMTIGELSLDLKKGASFISS